MEFRVLGPLEVVADGRVIPVGSPRLRALLAILLVRANKVVGFDALIEAVWGDAVPANPRPAVHTLVTRLRILLGTVQIESGGDGYRIVIHEDQVDIERFQAGIAKARTAGAREGEILQRTLELWRGEPFADVPSDYVRRIAEPLAERRLQALERKFELDLMDGQHLAVLPDLQALTSEYPLRERFWALLMLALFRCGRQAEALQAYMAVRQRLVGELGVEPGVELRQAHQIVLAGADSAWRVECQLPIDIADFTNRDEELGLLLEWSRPSSSVPIVTISGPPGMGKSALMVRAGHRLIDQYPDGQWFLRLNGGSATPRPAEDLLAELLRTVGVDPLAVPEGVEARSNLLRARIAGRKVLLVLDDAASADQVSPLLPGRPGCAVLVSSRSDLAELSVLYGGKRLALQPLSRAHARDLLARMVGSRRCAQDEEAAGELADLCGRLPLALRIAAANLASRPSLRISRYAEDLSKDRLAKLKTPGVGGLAVRAAFDISFAALTQAEQRAFSLLGVVPGNDFTQAAAAALFDDAAEILDKLVSANLVETQGEDRFRLHDLIRDYAADRSHAYDRDQAFERLADWYIHTAHQAVGRSGITAVRLSDLGPAPAEIIPLDFAADVDALHWLDSECANYLALTEYAAVNDPARCTWQLAEAVHTYLYHRFRIAELVRALSLGLERAQEAGDRRAVAVMSAFLGGALSTGGQFDEAVSHLSESHAIAVELGDDGIQATALTGMAVTYAASGSPLEAVRCGEEALEHIDQDAEQHTVQQMAALLSVGMGYVAIGKLPDALKRLHEVVELATMQSTAMIELSGRVYLGLCLYHAGEYDKAAAQFEYVAVLSEEQNITHIDHIVGLAAVHCAKGDLRRATEYASVALEQARKHGYVFTEAQTYAVFGDIALSADRADEALENFYEALRLAQVLQTKVTEVDALIGMARAGQNVYDATKAADLARAHGLGLLEAKALTALAEVRIKRGEPAREIAEQALAMHREFGCAPGEKWTLAVLTLS